MKSRFGAFDMDYRLYTFYTSLISPVFINFHSPSFCIFMRFRGLGYNGWALPVQKGGVHMALTILSLVGTFILSVIAGVVANYISDNLKR